MNSQYQMFDAPETALDNFEALTPAKDKVAERHPHIIVDYLTMSLGSIVITEDLHGPDNFDTWRVCRHEDYALLLVPVRVLRVALAKDKVHRAAWVAST